MKIDPRTSVLEARIGNLQEQLALLTEKNRNLVYENGLLKEEIDRLRTENSFLRNESEEKDGRISDLSIEMKELKFRTGMNSSNSSKPPSSDVYHKPNPKSLRKKSGKERGGQYGHKGSTIELPHLPDEVVVHYPSRCSKCPHLHECEHVTCSEKRFVIDMVTITRVTEHQRMTADCPYRIKGHNNSYSTGPESGTFPENVNARIQYGDALTSLVGTLDVYGAMSDQRVSTLVRSLFGITLSPGTVVNMTKRCAELAAPYLEKIREELIKSGLIHLDESGLRLNGDLVWLHDVSNAMNTYLTVHKKRGLEGTMNDGVIPDFDGTVVHDCWSPYFKLINLTHALCNAHFLRELNGVLDVEPDHKWASQFIELLLDMKESKEKAIIEGKDSLDSAALEKFDKRYD